MRPGAPSRSLLEHTCSAFSALPWENLTKMLRKASSEPGPGRLRDPLTVMEDHISNGTGGTCFSLVATLGEILSSLGFDARPVMGDMRHGRDIHCALLARIGEDLLLLDPGYLVAEPVTLGRAHAVSVGPSTLEYRTTGDGRVEMGLLRDGSFDWRCTLRLDRLAPGVFEDRWLESFDSPGMNGLHLSRVSRGERLYAHDANLRIEGRAGGRNLKMRDDWAGIVAGSFGVDRRLAESALEAWRGLRGR